MALLNKHTIVEKIIAGLAVELESYARSARAAHAEATDEQCKAENKYDTRGLEASYLARAQSGQAAGVEEAIRCYEGLALRRFAAKEAVAIGAVVELEHEGARSVYFIGPLAGGAEVECEGRDVLVITPQSPMGRQLLGHKKGERLQIEVGGTSENYRILAVT